jgi:hypothetical protein
MAQLKITDSGWACRAADQRIRVHSALLSPATLQPLMMLDGTE